MGKLSSLAEKVTAALTDFIPIVDYDNPLSLMTKKLSVNTLLSKILQYVGGSGGAGNVYFTNLDSTTDATYKQLSYFPNSETLYSVTLANSTALLGTFIYDTPSDVSLLPAGEWRFHFHRYVTSQSNETTLRFDIFKRTAGGVETVLFSIQSDDINDTVATQEIKSITKTSFALNTTDKLGIKVYATTTSNSSVTVTLVTGGNNASWFTTPLPAWHYTLRGRNNASQHTASAIDFTPTGSIASTTVQTAIAELDSEKAALSGATFTGNIVVPTPTSSEHATTKNYVDTIVSNVSVSTIGFVSKSAQNTLGVLINGKLFSANGTPISTDASWSTGRGVGNSLIVCPLDNMKLVNIPSISPIVKCDFLSALGYALLANGELYTWGQNSVGECGLGHYNNVLVPTLSNTNVVDVYSHGSQNEYYGSNQGRLFIKKTDGYVYACGYNGTYGTLGLGTTTANYSTWQKLTDLGTGVQKLYPIGAGYAGCVVALTSDGKIKACGWNGNGQLGDGTATSRTSFVDVTSNWAGVASGVADIKVTGGSRLYIDAGDYQYGWLLILITLSSGSKIVKSCGYGGGGNLGTGNNTAISTPATVLNSTNVIDISFSGGAAWGACAMLKSDNTLWVWGDQENGKLGTGAITGYLSTPTQVMTGVSKLLSDGLTKDVYASDSIPLFVVKTDGTLWGTGYNQHGQLGNGTAVNQSTFVQVKIPNGESVVGIGMLNARYRYSAFVAYTDKVNMYAFGNNAYNQINHNYSVNGNGTTCLTPIQLNLPRIN